MTIWPPALIANPVPVWVPVLADLGLFALQTSPPRFWCGEFAGAVDPAGLDRTDAVGERPKQRPVEVRLKFNAVFPAWATIRLAFWNVRATLGGIIAVNMISEFAVANGLAWNCPSKVTSIGVVLPLVR